MRMLQSSPRVPDSVRTSALWFALAVLAGVLETIIMAVDGLFIDTDAYSGAEIAANVVFRVVVYGSVLVVIRHLLRGDRWPSIVLTVVLGVFGMGSLVVPYLMWLADGNSVIDGIRGLDTTGALFSIVRVLHVAFVVLGLVYLYLPRSRRFHWGTA